MDVADHLHNVAKELRGKDKLIIKMCDNIWSIKFRCQLCDNQVTLLKLPHSPHLQSVDPVYSELNQELDI